MQHYENLKAHYQFTKEEAQILKELQPVMEKCTDEFLDGFYDYIWGFGKTAEFLKNSEIIAYHRGKLNNYRLKDGRLVLCFRKTDTGSKPVSFAPQSFHSF